MPRGVFYKRYSMSKRDRELVKKQLNRALTVGILRDMLAFYPNNTPVGVVGHYGEALLCKLQGSVGTRSSYLTASENWDGKKIDNINILVIETPDKGPDPY